MKNSILLFTLFIASLFISLSPARANSNPNASDMESLIRSNAILIQGLMEEDQGLGPVVMDSTSIRCLGLEHPGSPIGACLVNSKTQDDSFFFFYSITVAMPNDDSQNSDAYGFSVKLIEKAQN